MPSKANIKQAVATKKPASSPAKKQQSPVKQQQSIAKQQPAKQQPIKSNINNKSNNNKSNNNKSNNNKSNNNKSNNNKSNTPIKQNKNNKSKLNKKQQDEDDEEDEIDDTDLKRQLQEMISSGGNFDDEDFDEDEEDDDDQDVMDFDDSEEDEAELEDEEYEEEEELDGGEELEDEEDEEYEEDEEIDQQEEIEELEDQLVDDLYDEMNEDDGDSEEEEEEEEEEEPQMQVPAKKLSKNIQMSGQVFQGVARVEDYLKQESLKPKKKPEMIRELNPEDELVETSDLSADEQEEEQEDQPQQLTNNKYIVNDKEGINNKLRELKLSNGKIPWVHTLAVTSQQPLELEDIHDDFKREIAFYKQTLQSVMECEKLCADHGLLVRRKPDFFAEMVKSDEQMHKIKANIQSEKKRVETAEAIRKKREIKKFGKQVQTQKLLERQKQKSDAIESVKKWRKNREKGNVSDEFNIDLIDDVNNNKKDRKKVEKSKLPMKSDKRQKKDAKYGFGGKKRYAKTNDKSSVNDMSSFSLKKNNEDKDYSRGKGSKMNKGGRGGKSSRPGKSKRSRK